ncbi:MAG TPA: ATP-binding protein [Bacteroidota bacterium]|nr:ATP-binding protein [Bacteroidota bacterium]
MKKPPRRPQARKASPSRREVQAQTFTFECFADPKEIRKVEPFLQEINSAARLDDGTYYRLLVAGTEAVNNGILHGNKSDPRKKVSVVCTVNSDELVFRVHDQGRGFKPEDVPDPLEEKNLLKTSGRGIFLMRSLMDKVSFKVTKEGTEVELVIDLKHLS